MSDDKPLQRFEPLPEQPSPTHDLMVTPAMLEAAVQMGPDGRESLAMLREMQREERAAWAERQFTAALAAFQGECPRIKPNREGAHRAPYADREHIMAVIQPYLTKHGLTATYGQPTTDERAGQAGFGVVCIVRHVDGHSERSPFVVPREKPGNRMNVSQAEGSASEYAMRYALKLALNLRVKVSSGDKDDDGQAAGAPEPVTEHQAAELRALWDDVMGMSASPANFFKYLHQHSGVLVDTWSAVPSSSREWCVAELEAKRNG